MNDSFFIILPSSFHNCCIHSVCFVSKFLYHNICYHTKSLKSFIPSKVFSAPSDLL
ncbi:hypothetical protein HMPREF0868_0227 [Mageeibacillus indolicus UPII9-5]|uniref:Uncharacterized protein n=1 Tax=Mageeibacillus indolicus (strain UPII9-5) TaxID=699246 RepID=D3R058_MAGIU|nr:hypothetical protein HMPREF0868_0227 [Mageeibacillus indolicus UPII9-5]